jgi:hypothetical protein
MLPFAFCAGLNLNLLRSRRQGGDQNSDHDCRTYPNHGLPLKGLAEFKREIELVTQARQITPQAVARVGRFLP